MSAGNRGEWVVVPREPTPEMIAEGSKSIACDTDPMRKPQRTTRERAARNAFVTMLSASPAQPPSNGCDGVVYAPDNAPRGLDECPITGRPFFMNMDHEELGCVPTYGGPFDSFTIPALSDDGSELRSERYDHDAGHWIEGGEPVLDVLTSQMQDEWIAETRELAELKRAATPPNDPPQPSASSAPEAGSLLPCPFCGPGESTVGLWFDDVHERWRVGCGRCGASTGVHGRASGRQPAIKAWNRRGTPATATQEAGVWRCEVCGDMKDDLSPAWRWNGEAWEHKHEQGGHFAARYFGTVPEAGKIDEALRIFINAQYPVSTEINPRGYAWSEAYLDQALPIARAALAAAGPEAFASPRNPSDSYLTGGVERDDSNELRYLAGELEETRNELGAWKQRALQAEAAAVAQPCVRIIDSFHGGPHTPVYDPSPANSESTSLTGATTTAASPSAAQQEAGESLPCPFCGSRNVSDGENLIEAEAHGVGKVTVKQSECLNCGACGPLSKPVNGPDYGDVAAIAAWNRRAAPQPAPVQSEGAARQEAVAYMHCRRVSGDAVETLFSQSDECPWPSWEEARVGYRCTPLYTAPQPAPAATAQELTSGAAPHIVGTTMNQGSAAVEACAQLVDHIAKEGGGTYGDFIRRTIAYSLEQRPTDGGN
jgi:Lar family restriction alleviation protein